MGFKELFEVPDEQSIIKDIVDEASSELDSMQHSEEKIIIKIDLSLQSFMPLGSSAHLGHKSTDFVQRMLNQHESLYAIAIILKEFLNNRGLLDNSQGSECSYKQETKPLLGGLSSYCLVVMIVAIFRKFGDEGYLKSLRRFFTFYGELFNPETTGIAIVGPE